MTLSTTDSVDTLLGLGYESEVGLTKRRDLLPIGGVTPKDALPGRDPAIVWGQFRQLGGLPEHLLLQKRLH